MQLKPSIIVLSVCVLTAIVAVFNSFKFLIFEYHNMSNQPSVEYNMPIGQENTQNETVLHNTDMSMVNIYSNRVIDYSGNLFSDDELLQLSNKADSLSESCKMDIMICIIPSLNGNSISQLTADFYRENNSGFGNERDGVAFVIALEEREYNLLRSGNAIEMIDAFVAENAFIDDLKRGDYFLACMSYLTYCEEICLKK